MTPISALAVIGAITLLRFAVVALTSATARVRAHRAVSTLVGRAYWSPDMVIGYQPATFIDSALADVATFHPAADDQGVITRRLPRGWAPSGRVIDVQMEVM